jgi:hypothetical protein
MSATSTALSIPEILEQIISELPPLNIVRCQSVNSTWERLIAGSPLLQYKAWLHNDCPDSIQHVRAEDLMPKTLDYLKYDDDAKKDFEKVCYIHNVSKHLHPILVSRDMHYMPEDPSCDHFDPLLEMDEYGYGGSFRFRPILIRDLAKWYAKHKSTEHIWGHMSLYRPEAREISWELPGSERGWIPLHLEAVHDEDPDHEFYTTPSGQVSKRPGQPLVLTLSDLMRRLDVAWERWLESEGQEHFLSHDGAGCDFDQGIPAASCLTWEYTQEDYDDPYVTIRPKFGTKKTMEEHIERALLAASR